MNPTILIFAMRYALGRTTAAPSIVAREIERHWHKLNRHDKEQIVSEIKAAIKFNQVGDKITWSRVLKLAN